MSKYIRHGVHLGPSQMRKLMSAARNGSSARIRLSHSALHGHHHLHLTKMQHHRLSKKHHAGLGAEIELSHAQLKHMHGHGFFSNLVSAATPFIKEQGLNLAKMGAKKGLELGQNYLQNKINQKLGGATHRRKRVSRRRVGRPRIAGKHGRGFFGDLVKSATPFIKEQGLNLAKMGAKKGLELGQNYLQNKINQKLGGGRKRRVGRPRKGKGIVAPGGGLYAPGSHGGGIFEDILGQLL
jgi:hypothetical protein